MGTVLQYRASTGKTSRSAGPNDEPCRIVIFPGVRIERHQTDPDLDLSHRLHDTAGRDSFDGFGGGRPRKSS